jgi:maltose O-acetyltransferase
VRFVAVNGIYLAERCGIGHNVTVTDSTHAWQTAAEGEAPWDTPLSVGEPLRIETGAWIGNNSVIAGGLTIGARSIVAPNSVVTRSIPPDTLVSGNPARRVPFPRGLKVQMPEE